MLGKVRVAALTLLIACAAPAAARADQDYTDTGPNPADIADTVAQFRADLGGLNPNVAGSFTTGRREINWDDVPDSAADPHALPGDYFNTTSPRGAVLSTPGTKLLVSARAGNPDGVQTLFGFGMNYQPFSGERIFDAAPFTAPDANPQPDFTVMFVIPGTTTPAPVHGVGAVFLDVDNFDGGALEPLDANGNVIRHLQAPEVTTPDHALSFAGFTAPGKAIYGVRIVSGGSGHDLVAIDDLIYGEPGTDNDGDGIAASADNCPDVANPAQENNDGDAQGDACDGDDDNDGVPDGSDALPANAGESADTDHDGQGDNADADDDNDGVPDAAEAAQGSDPKNADTDGDGRGDGSDDCPAQTNADQTDRNGDGQGDACDDIVAPGITSLKLA
ncbi:MAG: hypothetical protein QOJ07_3818, partial [Thermoleophilaceae bacterium]|nr:hypothetical protein [Thermoleophilaceae bacterium]